MFWQFNCFLKPSIINGFSKIRRKVSSNHKTICNISTPHGPGAIAIVRVSGPAVQNVIQRMTIPNNVPNARQVKRRKIIDPLSSETLDDGLLIYFQSPNTYTGEDLCEFHLHGGVAIVNAVIGGLLKLDNVRLSLPGEFTKRGFYHNKFDLTQVEAIGDLLSAETDQQRRQAQLVYQGGLRKRFNDWSSDLTTVVAHIEADIDFAETEEVHIDLKQLQNTIRNLLADADELIKSNEKACCIKNGLGVGIYGAPNVGKSSLFNVLTASNKAIVTNIPGTTRDVLETRLDVCGFAINLFDTAGLKDETSDPIEKEGMCRAIELLTSGQTHLHFLVISAPEFVHEVRKGNLSAAEYIRRHVVELGLETLLQKNNENELFAYNTMVILNKIDILSEEDVSFVQNAMTDVHCISCKSKKGLKVLIGGLEQNLKSLCGYGNSNFESARVTTYRQLQYLKGMQLHLQKAWPLLLEENVDLAILCDQIRHALKELGFLTGQVVNEDILNEIFRDFCIGK